MSPMRGHGGDAAVKLILVFAMMIGFVVFSWIASIAFVTCVSG